MEAEELDLNLLKVAAGWDNVLDWLHLQEDGVILNHSKMKKFGFEVGELVITIIKDFPPHKTH